eukprot:m.12630 g.12630  ORF g.12630 m.12630 type:complete len:118 (+) comp17602_c0_seq2:2062-2415(+)
MPANLTQCLSEEAECSLVVHSQIALWTRFPQQQKVFVTQLPTHGPITQHNATQHNATTSTTQDTDKHNEFRHKPFQRCHSQAVTAGVSVLCWVEMAFVDSVSVDSEGVGEGFLARRA